VNDTGAIVARAQSDRLGDFRIFDLPPAAYTLRFTLPAHVTLAASELRVQVEAGRATVVELAARDRRADAGVAGALFSIFSGFATAE
jgi:hypothetical protein